MVIESAVAVQQQCMKASNQHQSMKNFCFGLLCFIGAGVVSQADEELEPRLAQSTNSKGEVFTVMDVDAMIAYREKRHATLTKALVESNLSEEHQELIANAMAKAFVGVPVSSYTETNRSLFKDEEPIESTDNWTVSDFGHIRHDTIPTLYGLTKFSPFNFLPPMPFRPETGILIEESDDEAKFEFDIDMSKFEELGDSGLADYPGIINLIVEVVANKFDQTPKLITIRLKKPLRQRFVFLMKTISTEYHYTFVDNCGCSAISKSKTVMDGSMIFIGKIFASSESTFNNIVCEPPLQFLLPDLKTATFLSP